MPTFTVAAATGLIITLLTASGGCLFQEDGDGKPSPDEYYATSVVGLPSAARPDTLRPADGEVVVLTAAPVKKVLKGLEVRMLAYNGSIPGPFIRVQQGTKLILRVRNRLGMPTSLHGHGLRMERRLDVPSDAQGAIADGDSLDMELAFPDPGAFWYRAQRGDAYGLEMGLYGGIVVEARDSAYWPAVHREEYLLLDDFLLEDGGARFRKDHTTHARLGRLGNVFLANGDTGLVLYARPNEVIRFHLANVANGRVLNVGFHSKDPDGLWLNHPIRVVGSDLGRLESSIFPVYQILSPGERMVIDVPVIYGQTLYLNHSYPKSASEWEDVYIPLATIALRPDSVAPDILKGFYDQVKSSFTAASIDSFRGEFTKPPDKRIFLTVAAGMGPLAKRAHDSTGKGIVWEDLPVSGMPNAESHSGNTRWVIRDLETGLENQAIHWTFDRGGRAAIRIVNDPAALYPMPHPIHFQGQRFLVLRINGAENKELAWKDTYLMGRGETADILLDASTPGTWRMRCHIAEHSEAGEALAYTVR